MIRCVLYQAVAVCASANDLANRRLLVVAAGVRPSRFAVPAMPYVNSWKYGSVCRNTADKPHVYAASWFIYNLRYACHATYDDGHRL